MDETSYQKKSNLQLMFRGHFQNNNVEAVAEMLQEGKEFYPDINARFTLNYPVMMALTQNNIPMLNVLFQAGANLDVKDDGGWHFSHELMNKSEKLIRGLAPYATFNVSLEDGTTPLLFAAESGKWEAVDVLLSLDKPLRVYAIGDGGNTVAHHLAKAGKIEALQSLFKFSDAHEAFVKNNNGDTPLSLIESPESRLLIKALCDKCEKEFNLTSGSSPVLITNPVVEVPINGSPSVGNNEMVTEKPVKKMGMGGIKKNF